MSFEKDTEYVSGGHVWTDLLENVITVIVKYRKMYLF